MTIPTCAVVCRTLGNDGPLAGVPITATLSRYEVHDGYVVPQRVEAVTDEAGEAVLNLWPNELGSAASWYIVRIEPPGGKQALSMRAVVPSAATVLLHEIADLPTYPGKPDGQLASEAAVLAAAQARGDRELAEAARVGASEAHDTAAEFAQTAVQSASTAQFARAAADEAAVFAGSAAEAAGDASNAAAGAAEAAEAAALAADESRAAAGTLATQAASSAGAAAVSSGAAAGAVSTLANIAWANVLAALATPQYDDETLPFAIADQFGQPILGVRADGFAHALLDQLPGVDLLDEQFVWAVTDGAGQVLFGFRRDGYVQGLFDIPPATALPGTDTLDGNFRWAILDAADQVLLGIKWDGEAFLAGSGSSATSQAFLSWGGVWAIGSDGYPVQVTSGVDVADPKTAGSEVRWLQRQDGGYASASAAIPSSSAWPAFATEVLHLVSNGQSLSMGSLATVATTRAQCANRLRTLADGVRQTNYDVVLNPGDCLPLRPLVSKTQEVPIVQHAAQLQRIGGLPSNAGVVASAHGRGGYTIEQLAKGTLYYSNSMTAITQVRADALAAGRTYRVPYLDWIQGEANRSDAAGAYQTKLLQLQADFEADVKAITGQAGNIPVLGDQISNWTAYNLTVSFVPLEQLQAALQYPDRIVCAGPKYWLETVSDGVHLTSLSSRRLGAMHARAAEAVIAGQRWFPTHCYSATRNGAVVTLKFHTPAGRLVADKVNVTDPGNLGIRYVDDTNSAAVTAVVVNLDNSVTVTLSGVPTGANPTIGIADIGIANANGGPTTGARSCLRDSSTDRCGDGMPLWNWACHQRIAVN